MMRLVGLYRAHHGVQVQDTATVEIGVLLLILRSFDLLHSSRVYAVLHIRTTSLSSNQPTREIWLATLSASFVYTITARLR